MTESKAILKEPLDGGEVNTTPVEDVYVLEREISHLLRRAHRRAGALFAAAMGQDDLTAPQFATLCKLAEQQAVSQNQLGRQIGMDAATMQGVARRLVDRGLIERKSHSHDRRRVLLSLTPAGRRRVRDALPVARKVSQEVLAPLSVEDQQVLLRLLRQIG